MTWNSVSMRPACRACIKTCCLFSALLAALALHDQLLRCSLSLLYRSINAGASRLLF